MGWDANKFAQSSGLTPAAPAAQPLWSADKFGATLRDRMMETDAALARSLFDDVGTQAERVNALAQQFGVAPEQVKPNLNEYEVMDLARRVGTAPTGVQRYLRDPNNRALLPMVDELSAVGRVMQNIAEFHKGIPEGALRTGAMALEGLGASHQAARVQLETYYDQLDTLAGMTPEALAAYRAEINRTVSPSLAPELQHAINAVLTGEMSPEEARATFYIAPPLSGETLQDAPFFRAGEWLNRNADLFPAREGFEQSPGRQLGQGVGSIVAGVGASATMTPIGAGAFFMFAGAGEAVERAIEAGATEEQILEAARLGYVPGLTDALPVEVLLGRIPVPGGKYLQVPAGLLGKALKAIGRVGWQAFIEGVQEGGQAYLQNLIAQEVYNPEQDLTEGIVPEGGVGAGVGAIAEIGRQILSSFAGRRGGGGVTQPMPEQQTAAAMQQVIETVQQTEVDPAKLRGLIDTIAPEGTVLMPVGEVQRLYQEGKIDDATLAQWGIGPQLEEAVAAGGDVSIPARDFLTAPIPKGSVAEIVQHVRLQATARTAAEAEVDRQLYEEQVQELMDRLGEVEDRQAQGDLVFETIRKELIAAGRSEREAEASATLWRERYLLRASQRDEGDADTMFLEDRVRVLGPRVGPETRQAATGNLDLVIARLQSGREVSVQKRPLLDELKARGGVEPGSPLARELEALGITAKAVRGLFRKGGLKAVDNIPVSEVPVLRDNQIAADANGYADERALMDAIGAEFAGSPLVSAEDRARIDMLDAPVEELRAMLEAAGIDYRTASPEALRAFLETALRSEPETEGEVETELGQPAYHGSPHVFERFDLRKIGTGEGAQAYGWGLYFAGLKKVAEYYRATLTAGAAWAVEFEGSRLKNTEETARLIADRMRAATKIDVQNWVTVALVRHFISLQVSPASRSFSDIAVERIFGNRGTAEELSKMSGVASRAETWLRDNVSARRAGRLFKVEIPENDDLLNWDVPLSEQPEGLVEKMRAAFRDAPERGLADFDAENVDELIEAVFANDPNFEGVYNSLSHIYGSDQAASGVLRAAGIPGHRYTDAGSRVRGLRILSPSESVSGKWVVGQAPNGPNEFFDNEADARAAYKKIVEAQTYNYVIYDDARIQVESFEQPDDSGMRRGAFERQRDKYGNISNIVRLTRNADRSTFLHETGHFWLFQLVEDAFDPAVREADRVRLRADLATVLDWFGVKADLDSASPADVLAAIQVEHHEKWARGTEAYFMEGKAPSIALRDVFTRFAGWLRRIYAKLTALDVDLGDDVRAVMDRLLATDAAIEQARGANLYRVPAELLAELTPGERASIEKLAEEAGAEAFHALHSRIVRQMEKEARADWKAERETVEREATLLVRRRPVYAALNLLRDGVTPDGSQLVDDDGKPRTFKLDRAELKERYGEEIVGLLPGGIFAKRGEASIRLDAFAGLTGFRSGDELRLALMAIKGQSEAATVAAEVRAEMARRHGDVTAEIDRAATEIVRNDKQAELMGLQARYLRRLAGDKMRKAAERETRKKGAASAESDRARVEGAASDTERVADAVGTPEAMATAQIGEEMARATAAAGPAQRQAQRAAGGIVRGLRDNIDADLIREAARRFIRSRKVRDLGSPAAIEQRIARKTREIEQAVATRDYEAAAVLMEQRLFNLFLAREVRDAQNATAKAQAYLQTFSRKPVRQRLGKAGAEYLDRVDELLERYDFRPATNRDLAKRQSLADWLAAQEAQGLSPEIPAEVMERAGKINFRDATYGELLALRDAVKSIAHVAAFKNKLLREKERRELNEIVDEGIASIEAHTEARPVQINPQRQTVRNRMTRAFSGYFALLTKARTWLETLDGFERGRFFDRTILKPIRDAEVALLGRKDAEARKLRALTDAIKGRLGETVHIPAIGDSLALEERLSVALNWGNESSREAVLEDGQRRWSQAQVDAILDTLTREDWRFVQATWDYVDSFWPEIAELHRKRTGLPPEKVAASPVVTKFGTMRGGYYPLIYDADMSSRSRENTIEQEFEGMNAGRYAAAATRRGHTKERVGSGGQSVKLSLDVIPQHVNQVLTDLVMGPAVSDVWKVLNHPRMKAAIEEALGAEAITHLDMWIKDAAVGQIMAGDRLSRAFRGLRTSVSAGAMGFKLATSLVQITGYTQTVVELGPKWALAGLVRFGGNPAAMGRKVREVHAASAFMATRHRTFLRDVADALADARGKGARGAVLQTLFWPIAKMQLMVDIPTWLGAFQKAEAEGHPDPVAFADATVEAGQSSGLMSVLSPVERGSVSQGTRLNEFVKLWTSFYSYFNAKLNIAMRKTRATDFRKPGEIAHLAADYLMLFWVEAALGDVILRALPDWLGGADDDDDEDKDFVAGIMFQIELTLMNAAATLPLVRETAGALRGFDAAPAATRGLEDVARGVGAVGDAGYAALSADEDIDWARLIQSIVSAGNIVSPVKYPSSQINVALKAMEDEDATWIDYLLAAPRR